MKDQIQKLLDQIKRDFPNGCDSMDCKDCPLDRGDAVAVQVCDMLVKLKTHEG